MDYKTTDMKIIKNDWQKVFSQLKNYKNQIFIKRCGPICIGIELDKIMSKTYRPLFVLFSLLDTSYNFFCNIISQHILNEKKLTIDIDFDRHHMYFQKTRVYLKEQALLDIDNQLSLSKVIEAIFKYLQFDYVRNFDNFYEYKNIILLSKLLNDNSKSEQFINRAIFEIQKFNILGNEEDPNNNIKCLDNIIKTDKEALLKKIEESIKKYKLEKIPNYELDMN